MFIFQCFVYAALQDADGGGRVRIKGAIVTRPAVVSAAPQHFGLSIFCETEIYFKVQTEMKIVLSIR